MGQRTAHRHQLFCRYIRSSGRRDRRRSGRERGSPASCKAVHISRLCSSSLTVDKIKWKRIELAYRFWLYTERAEESHSHLFMEREAVKDGGGCCSGNLRRKGKGGGGEGGDEMVKWGQNPSGVDPEGSRLLCLWRYGRSGGRVTGWSMVSRK